MPTACPARISLLLGIKFDDQQLQLLELFLVAVAISNVKFIFNPYGFNFEKEGGDDCYALKRCVCLAYHHSVISS